MVVDAREYICGRCGKTFPAHPDSRAVSRARVRGQSMVAFNARCEHCGYIAPQRYPIDQ